MEEINSSQVSVSEVKIINDILKNIDEAATTTKTLVMVTSFYLIASNTTLSSSVNLRATPEVFVWRGLNLSLLVFDKLPRRVQKGI